MSNPHENNIIYTFYMKYYINYTLDLCAIDVLVVYLDEDFRRTKLAISEVQVLYRS